MIDCCFIDVDPGEMPDPFSSSWRTARKVHECNECGEPIRPGDRYEYAAGKWGGDWMVYKTCRLCARIRADLFKCGYHFTQLREELWECYGVEL